MTSSGWRHDAFGRAIEVPSSDSGGRGALAAGYYTDDLVRQLTLDGRSHTYDRDPFGRTAPVFSTGGSILPITSRNRYADDTDTPVATTRTDGTTVRDISGPSGQLVAIKDGTSLTYQLRDSHGSIVATAPASPAATPSARTDYGAFGNVTSETPNVVGWIKGVAGYGWLGSHQRTTADRLRTIWAADCRSSSDVDMGTRFCPRYGCCCACKRCFRPSIILGTAWLALSSWRPLRSS